jgi:hypothetical protein
VRNSILLKRLTREGLRDVTEESFQPELVSRTGSSPEPRLLVSGVLGELVLSWIVGQLGGQVLSTVFALPHLRQDRAPTDAEVLQWIEAARRVGRSYSDHLSVYHAEGWRALWRGQSLALIGVDAQLAETFFKGDDTAGAALWDRLEEAG